MNRSFRLILLAAALIATLAVMAGTSLVRRESGAEIRLALEPVDPRDLLMGHYVVVRTPAHSLETAALGGVDDWTAGDEIFVALTPRPDGLMEPVSLHRQPRPGEIGLRGRVRSAFEPFRPVDFDPETGEPLPETDTVDAEPGLVVNAVFNIERYYASPEDALALERMVRDSTLALILSVDENGDAVIKGLVIDGEARYDRLF